MSSSAPNTFAIKSALVFGASSEQGRAVLEGLVNRRTYASVHACTRDVKGESTYLIDGIGATSVLKCDVQNPQSVRDALVSTNATAIFFVTTTDLPSIPEQAFGSFADAASAEYEVIVEFFHVFKDVYEHDRLPRHVVLTVHDNVQRVARELLEATGETWIEPLDDGSIVPHYSAKGKGGEYAVQYLKDTPDLQLTLITLPFLYSNFLGFFAPLPNEGRTQWMLTACFGDGSNKIDMMATSDLATIVRTCAMNHGHRVDG
jgi:NmrA-like family